jgi:hypothetical protein
MLARAGVKLSSIAAYPCRRRRGDISLDFRERFTYLTRLV